jgi:hypothetical protein
MVSFDRRGVLRSAGLVAASSLAGCAFGFGGTNETVGVDMSNQNDASHRLSVTVTFDDTALVDVTERLAPGESTETQFENPASAGPSRVEAALANGRSTSTDVRVGPGTGIRHISVRITPDGTVEAYGART